MSTLKSRLRADLTAAIRSRDELRTSTLRMALAAVTTAEVAGRTARELSADEVAVVLSREAKKRREAAEAFDSGGRPELAARERSEAEVLADYLPAQLSDGELADLVSAAIADSAATDPRQLGAVMRVVAPRVAGRAEGSRVAAEVRRQLGSG